MEKNIPPFLTLTRKEQKATLEALIFASDEPLPLQALFRILIEQEPAKPRNIKPAGELDFSGEAQEEETTAIEIEDKFEFSTEYFQELIEEINSELTGTGRPFIILLIAGGYQYATRNDYGELLARLVRSKIKKRLSQASLETLSIIAYKQPVSKPEVEQIRGVNSNEIMNALLEKGLIEIVGRKDVLGKPLLYGTTEEFLRVFGLYALEDLPKLRELDEIAPDDISPIADTIELTIDVSDSTELMSLQDHIDLDYVIENELPEDDKPE